MTAATVHIAGELLQLDPAGAAFWRPHAPAQPLSIDGPPPPQPQPAATHANQNRGRIAQTMLA